MPFCIREILIMKNKNNKEVDVQGLTSKKRAKKQKCCLCGEELDKYGGNDPWPFRYRGRCCKFCYDHIVIPFKTKKRMEMRERHLAVLQSIISQFNESN